VEAVRNAPLVSLDLSANAGVSGVVGTALLTALHAHPTLCELNVEHTSLSSLNKNALAAAQTQKVGLCIFNPFSLLFDVSDSVLVAFIACQTRQSCDALSVCRSGCKHQRHSCACLCCCCQP
jgi:hypothetical protein